MGRMRPITDRCDDLLIVIMSYRRIECGKNANYLAFKMRTLNEKLKPNLCHFIDFVQQFIGDLDKVLSVHRYIGTYLIDCTDRSSTSSSTGATLKSDFHNTNVFTI